MYDMQEEYELLLQVGIKQIARVERMRYIIFEDKKNADDIMLRRLCIRIRCFRAFESYSGRIDKSFTLMAQPADLTEAKRRAS